MSSLLFVPTACQKCNRTWLALPPFEEAPLCPHCQGRADVVPGECYRAEDILLFESIERAVSAAQLSEEAAYGLWVVLSNATERWQKPAALLRPVVQAVPSLQLLERELGADRMQLARAVGMSLAVITAQLRWFEARRRQSPEVLLAPESSPPQPD